MRVVWQISDEDVARVRALFATQQDNAIVRKRMRLNLAADKPATTREAFWFQMVNGQLTSAQTSGPKSHVGRFIRVKPFPLAFKTVKAARDVEAYCRKAITGAGGIRFHNNIAERLAANLAKLEAGTWNRTLAQCDRLRQECDHQLESEIAQYLDDEFAGIGPKQARNMLQGLGLTRYETPLDSRVSEWLNENGFPIRIKASLLADVDYYSFVMEGFRALCARAGIFPCLFDAAVFALYDGDAWNDENVLGA